MSADDQDRGNPLTLWTALLNAAEGVQRAILDIVAAETTVAAGWLPVVVLLLNAPDERLPMSSLSVQLSMTSGGFTKLADRLEHAGLIMRIPSEDDRRVVYAALTPAGSEAAKQAVRIAGEQVRSRVLSEFTESELADIGARMSRLRPA
ncbi:MAG: MarR family transcriptional regulator [Pseudonocardiales bacterium]|nr:MarR family transcriptional regulator [Pseudonocardiales bacterium]